MILKVKLINEVSETDVEIGRLERKQILLLLKMRKLLLRSSSDVVSTGCGDTGVY